MPLARCPADHAALEVIILAQGELRSHEARNRLVHLLILFIQGKQPARGIVDEADSHFKAKFARAAGNRQGIPRIPGAVA